MLDDAGDGSGYDAAHSTHHPLLRELMPRVSQLSDLMFVDIDTLRRRLLGEEADGPRRQRDRRPVRRRRVGRGAREAHRVAVGDTVVSDSVFYVPTAGSPVVFLAAAVRSESRRSSGSIVAEVPVSALTAISTAGGDFELLGLGDTGETYLVGEDRTLRTEYSTLDRGPRRVPRGVPRPLRRRRAIANAIEIVGSPVLLQAVDNEAVTVGT